MIKTSTGFEADITAAALDDWELIEDLVAVESDGSKMVPVTRRLLGEEGMKKLKEHCRDENGRVRASRMYEEIGEIFHLLKENKETKN